MGLGLGFSAETNLIHSPNFKTPEAWLYIVPVFPPSRGFPRSSNEVRGWSWDQGFGVLRLGECRVRVPGRSGSA